LDVERRDRLWRFAPLGVGLLAFVLGLVRLTGQPRSYDEQVTIRTAERSLAGIWRAARSTEAPHLLYYLLMKPWLAAFGASDFAARFPSVLAGALTAVTLTVIGTRLYGRWTGLVAGITLALAAFVVHFWQWARSYSLALLLTTLSTYALLRFLGTGQKRWAAAWCVALAAACWLNLFAISLLGADAIAYLLHRPRPRPVVAVASAALLALLVTPIIILAATAGNGQLSWIPAPTLHRLVVQTWNWSSRNPLALVAAAVGAVVLVRSSQRRNWWKAGLVAAWVVAPFLLTLVLSAWQPAFDAHYLLTAAAGFALLVAVGITALPRVASLTLLSLVLAIGALQLVHYYVAPGKPLTSLL
jgi:mannosyltransferase